MRFDEQIDEKEFTDFLRVHGVQNLQKDLDIYLIRLFDIVKKLTKSYIRFA